MAMLHGPILSLSELNIVISVLGIFIVAYGIISVKIKQAWYLGEALPAMLIGIALGPIAAHFITPTEWGAAAADQQDAITLGMCRVVIGIQVFMAGYQLPARYVHYRWREMALLMLVIMTIMWLCTALCIMATIPKLTLLATMVIGACVTSTDPVLSQAVAKGPFADHYVRRPVRELISAEAGANDGFGFPFLMLATYLIRHHESQALTEELASTITTRSVVSVLVSRAGPVGRLGGGVGVALLNWFIETWLYFVTLSIVYGVICGVISMYALRHALRRGWIDSESYLLWPLGLSLFIVGTCGAIGTDDLLACFCAGAALNWDGKFLAETEAKHDEVNPSIDMLLNFGGFMYIGAVMPWSTFHDPSGTGITIGRLIGLGFLVLFFRRIPAILATYKLMPKILRDWKEALFMGYFGPIGIGAVFYVEHTRHIFPKAGQANTREENDLLAAMVPVVYFLALFSIVVHGLSIPVLDIIFKKRGVPLVEDEDGPQEINVLSKNTPLPPNARRTSNLKRQSIMVNNRFSRGALGGIDWDTPALSPMTSPKISGSSDPERGFVSPRGFQAKWKGSNRTDQTSEIAFSPRANTDFISNRDLKASNRGTFYNSHQIDYSGGSGSSSSSNGNGSDTINTGGDKEKSSPAQTIDAVLINASFLPPAKVQRTINFAEQYRH